MKKIIGITLVAVSLFAVDYNGMSIDELSSLRGTVPTEDRDAFRSAFQDKTQYLSPEEKAAYSRGNGQGNGTMTQTRTKTQQRLRDGSGNGGQYKGSRGNGGGGGKR